MSCLLAEGMLPGGNIYIYISVGVSDLEELIFCLVLQIDILPSPFLAYRGSSFAPRPLVYPIITSL